MKLFNFNPKFLLKKGLKPDAFTEVWFLGGQLVHTEREFYSLKTWFTHYRLTFWEWLKKRIRSPWVFRFEWVWLPQLELIGGRTITLPFAFAIAVDSANAGATQTDFQNANCSWTHTCTGSNLGLMVNWAGGSDGSSDNNSPTVTYNSASCGKIACHTAFDNEAVGQFYQVAPSTGANTVLITKGNTTSGTAHGSSISFTGSDQVTGYGASIYSNNSRNTVTSESLSINTTRANGFIVDCFALAGNFVISIGGSQTGISSRTNIGSLSSRTSYRATTTVTSYAMTEAWNGTDQVIKHLISEVLSPPPTSIFSANGVPQASIASSNGEAAANISSIYGVPNS